MTGEMNLRKPSLILVAALAAAMFAGMAIASAALANETVRACGLSDAAGANNVWAAAPIGGIAVTNGCKYGYGLDIRAGTSAVRPGHSASWSATAPNGLMIVLVYVPPRQLRENGAPVSLGVKVIWGEG